MKPILFILMAITLAVSAEATDVGVSVSVGQPSTVCIDYRGKSTMGHIRSFQAESRLGLAPHCLEIR